MSVEDRFEVLRARLEAEGVETTTMPVTDLPEWVEHYEGDAVANLTGHEWEICENYDFGEALFDGASEGFAAGLAIGLEAENRGRYRRRGRIEYIVRMLLDDPEKHWEAIKTLCSLMYLEGTDEAHEGDDDPDVLTRLAEAYPQAAVLPRWEQD